MADKAICDLAASILISANAYILAMMTTCGL